MQQPRRQQQGEFWDYVLNVPINCPWCDAVYPEEGHACAGAERRRKHEELGRYAVEAMTTWAKGKGRRR